MASNSDSGATVSSSTSAESELRQRFPESNVNGFKVRARGMMISTCSLLGSMFKSDDGLARFQCFRIQSKQKHWHYYVYIRN